MQLTLIIYPVYFTLAWSLQHCLDPKLLRFPNLDMDTYRAGYFCFDPTIQLYINTSGRQLYGARVCNCVSWHSYLQDYLNNVNNQTQNNIAAHRLCNPLVKFLFIQWCFLTDSIMASPGSFDLDTYSIAALNEEASVKPRRFFPRLILPGSWVISTSLSLSTLLGLEFQNPDTQTITSTQRASLLRTSPIGIPSAPPCRQRLHAGLRHRLNTYFLTR